MGPCTNSVLHCFLFCLLMLSCIDKTNYLNHYYFVSLVSFIIIFLPASINFSVDNKIFKRAEISEIPRFFILPLQLQMFMVYFFAGISKLNSDWLLEAQPLKIWLPAFFTLPFDWIFNGKRMDSLFVLLVWMYP